MKKITDWSAIFSVAGKTGILCALAFMLSPLSVQAQCGQWDIGGEWQLLIGDSKASETMVLTQSGTKVSGEAQINAIVKVFEKGKVTGEVKDDKVKFEILWVNEKRPIKETIAATYEQFEGTIGSDGKMGGRAYIFTLAGGVPVIWSSDRPMKCLYKTVHRLGTKPTTPTTVIAPMITASETNLAIPSGQTGQTVLTWDGGKDHPYAEVWVKVDDGDETFVVEQGKGTRQVTIERGKTYLYILADAGKRLATVTVTSRQ